MDGLWDSNSGKLMMGSGNKWKAGMDGWSARFD